MALWLGSLIWFTLLWGFSGMFCLEQFWPFSRVAGCLLDEPTAPPPPGFLTARRVSPWPSQPPQPHSASQFTECSTLSDCQVLLVLPSACSVLSSFLFGSVPSFPCLCPGFVLTPWLQGLPQQRLASPWPAGGGPAVHPRQPFSARLSLTWRSENSQSQTCARCGSAALLPRKWLVWGWLFVLSWFFTPSTRETVRFQ